MCFCVKHPFLYRQNILFVEHEIQVFQPIQVSMKGIKLISKLTFRLKKSYKSVVIYLLEVSR